MTLNFDELCKAQNDFNYNGGYYSRNKEFWDGMHQILIDKWNTRKPIDDIVEQLEKLIEENPYCSLANYRAGLFEAIEIVKGGADNA